jgi:hypothetical protein
MWMLWCFTIIAELAIYLYLLSILFNKCTKKYTNQADFFDTALLIDYEKILASTIFDLVVPP